MKRQRIPTTIHELASWILDHCREFPAPPGKGLTSPCMRWCRKDGSPYLGRRQAKFGDHWVASARIIYAAFHGTDIPATIIVRHKCDVASCNQADHLELGTQQDNARDAVLRQRRSCGDNAACRKNPNYQLKGENKVFQSPDAIIKIEKLLWEYQQSIAKA